MWWTLLLAIVPTLTGSAGTRSFTTTIELRNRGAAEARCTFSFESFRREERIAAGGTVVYSNVLADVAAPRALTVDCPPDVAVVSRIQESADGGRTFDAGRAFLPASSPVAKRRVVRTSADILLAEVAGKPVRVDTTARTPAGELLGAKSYDLPPRGIAIVNLEKPFRMSPELDLEIVVTSGSGSVVIGKQSRDPALAQMALAESAIAATAPITPQIGCPFQAAPFAEPRTGLCYVRGRWYDPSTGTFVTPDPAGHRDSSNRYAFAAADPVNHRDPTGEAASMSRGGWIVATDNARLGRIHRFSPGAITRDPLAVRDFLGRRADVLASDADALIARSGHAWSTAAPTLHTLAPGIARASGVYPLMATTAGAAFGGAAGSLAAAELSFGFLGSTLLPGFTGGLGAQAGLDLASGHLSDLPTYATAASAGAATSLAFGSLAAGGRRWVWGGDGVPELGYFPPPRRAWQYDIFNKGPLDKRDAFNFYGARYNSDPVTDADQWYWRAGDAAHPEGTWFTLSPPESIAQARIDRAIKVWWVNAETGIASVHPSTINSIIGARFPVGTERYFGPIATQGGVYLGGPDKLQIFIPRAKDVGVFKVMGPLE